MTFADYAGTRVGGIVTLDEVPKFVVRVQRCATINMACRRVLIDSQ
jgi:hypothetical protein